METYYSVKELLLKSEKNFSDLAKIMNTRVGFISNKLAQDKLDKKIYLGLSILTGLTIEVIKKFIADHNKDLKGKTNQNDFDFEKLKHRIELNSIVASIKVKSLNPPKPQKRGFKKSIIS